LQQYRRKKQTSVIAVQLDLETEGFVYQKWGGTQRCKRGDWLVNNQGDVYSVDRDTFARTYRLASPDAPGIYIKDAAVWAGQAQQPGTIQTKEGSTAYNAGDYLVFNDPAGRDGYAMTKERFQSLYELAET
jgi:hypothetical protein